MNAAAHLESQKQMFRLSPETAADWHEVENLFDTAFAPGREALSSYRLRDGVAPLATLSVVARDATDGIAGAIRYWPVLVGQADQPALLLGPVAVHPTHQGEGLGGALIFDTLERARGLGWGAVILVGDAPYYGRFGFQKALHLDFPPPTNPERILWLPLAKEPEIAGLVRRWDRPQ